jgi:hypothetical protein
VKPWQPETQTKQKIPGAEQLKSSRERIFHRTMRGRTTCVIIFLLMVEQSVEDSTMSVTATGIQLRGERPKLLYRRHGTLPKWRSKLT